MRYLITVLSTILVLTVSAACAQVLRYDDSVTRATIVEFNEKTNTKSETVCTAFIANGMLITASHCFDDIAPIAYDTDVTLIRASSAKEHSMRICTRPAHVGEDVIQIGYPGWAQGQQHRAYGKIIVVDDQYVTTDTSGYPGESGGPLISVRRDCVIGVLKSITIHTEHRQSQSLHTRLLPLTTIINKTSRIPAWINVLLVR